MTSFRSKAASRRSIVQQAVAVLLSVGALAGAVVSSSVAAQTAFNDTIPAASTSSAAAAAELFVAPTTGAVTYTLRYTPTSGAVQSVDVTYDFATSAWRAPAGWTLKANPDDGTTSLTRFDNTTGNLFRINLAAAPAVEAVTVNSEANGTVAPTNVDSYDGSVTTDKAFVVKGVDADGNPTGAVTGAVEGFVATLAAPVVVFKESTAAGDVDTELAAEDIVVKQNTVVLTAADVAGSFAGTLTATSEPVEGAPKKITDTAYTVQGGQVTGSTMTIDKAGINFSAIKGTARLLEDGGLSIEAEEAPSFTVDAATGNTFIAGTLEVKGLTTTNGLTNTGNITTDTLRVTGATTTNGLTNTGNISTTTLTVTGATVTNGLTNTGRITTGTLTVTGMTSTTGITNTGNLVNTGNLTVTGTTTTNGISNTGDITTTGRLTAASLSTTGNATVGGSLDVKGKADIGGPLSVKGRISGVQDGVAPTDAVNLRQLEASQSLVSRGVASVSALAGIPQLEQGKSFSVGAGLGNFNGQTAVAVGFSARLIRENIVVRAGIAGASGGKATGNAGVGYSW